jgi:hypothetical protein
MLPWLRGHIPAEEVVWRPAMPSCVQYASGGLDLRLFAWSLEVAASGG